MTNKEIQMPITHRVTVQVQALRPVLPMPTLALVPVSSGASSEMAKDGGEEEDYFVHFEDLKFTEEDLALIDRILEGGPHSFIPEPVLPLRGFGGKALVTIEVEKEPQPVPEATSPPNPSPRTPMPKPPYDAFRSGKSLSVSDLTGPLW